MTRNRLVVVVVAALAFAACSKKNSETTGTSSGTAAAAAGTDVASGTAVASGTKLVPGATFASGGVVPKPPGPVNVAPPLPPPEDKPRPPGPDEIDRCVRVLTAVSACGVAHDYELGWVKAAKKKLAAADAKKACSPATHIDEDGMNAFPVPILPPADVEKIEAAAKKDCKAVTDTLDEVSPGPGPAGHDPSK